MDDTKLVEIMDVFSSQLIKTDEERLQEIVNGGAKIGCIATIDAIVEVLEEKGEPLSRKQMEYLEKWKTKVLEEMIVYSASR